MQQGLVHSKLLKVDDNCIIHHHNRQAKPVQREIERMCVCRIQKVIMAAKNSSNPQEQHITSL